MVRRTKLMYSYARPHGYSPFGIVWDSAYTCKLNGVNPHAWLTDVLTKLVNRWPARRIDELMPWAYATPATL